MAQRRAYFCTVRVLLPPTPSPTCFSTSRQHSDSRTAVRSCGSVNGGRPCGTNTCSHTPRSEPPHECSNPLYGKPATGEAGFEPASQGSKGPHAAIAPLPKAQRRYQRRPRRLAPVSDLTVVILAAGEGTRMRSATPKVLHPLLGRPLVLWPVEAARRA